MNRTRTAFLAFAAGALLAGAFGFTADKPALVAPARPVALAEGPLTAYAPFLGVWEIEDAWADGRPIRARNVYEVGIGGKFIEAHTVATDEQGKPYERYHTVIAWDEDKQTAVSYGFTFDGTVGVVPLKHAENADTPTFNAAWAAEGGKLRQRVSFDPSGDTYRWQVWFRPEGAEDWQQLMDGDWHRVTD